MNISPSKKNNKIFSNKRLKREFFENHPSKVAPLLLGCYLVRNIDRKILMGKIVETEAYADKDDNACHVVKYGKTKRTEILFSKVGTAYVYPVHINRFCLNIVCHQKNRAGGILIRAIKLKDGNLISGPAKLCHFLKIDKKLNGTDMIEENELFVIEGEKIKRENILKTKRIGIPYAKKSKNWLWRFVVGKFL